MHHAGLKRAARGSLEMQDGKKSPKIAIWAPLRSFVGLYLRNVSLVWRTPANSNVFRILAVFYCTVLQQ